MTLNWDKPFTTPPTGYVIARKWRIEGIASLTPRGLMDVTAIDATGMYQSSAYFVVGTSLLNDGKVLA